MAFKTAAGYGNLSNGNCPGFARETATVSDSAASPGRYFPRTSSTEACLRALWRRCEMLSWRLPWVLYNIRLACALERGVKTTKLMYKQSGVIYARLLEVYDAYTLCCRTLSSISISSYHHHVFILLNYNYIIKVCRYHSIIIIVNK